MSKKTNSEEKLFQKNLTTYLKDDNHDLKQESDLRVLDYNDHHIFLQFSHKELDQPIYYEP